MIVKQSYRLTEKKNAVCKIVRPGDRARIGASVASGEKNGACSVLDVMSVEHKGQKRKLLLTEDETFTNSLDPTWKIL